VRDDFTIMNRLKEPLKKLLLLVRSCCYNSCNTVVLHCFQFQEFCASLCIRFWKPALCKVPGQVLRTMFETTIDFIQFVFSEIITICFGPVTTLSIKIYLNSTDSLYGAAMPEIYVRIFSLHLLQNTFHTDIVLEHPLFHSNTHLTCDILTEEITNLREWLFNTQDKYSSKN
jgi:hypothetical protein